MDIARIKAINHQKQENKHSQRQIHSLKNIYKKGIKIIKILLIDIWIKAKKENKMIKLKLIRIIKI